MFELTNKPAELLAASLVQTYKKRIKQMDTVEIFVAGLLAGLVIALFAARFINSRGIWVPLRDTPDMKAVSVKVPQAVLRPEGLHEELVTIYADENMGMPMRKSVSRFWLKVKVDGYSDDYFMLLSEWNRK